VSLKSPPTAAPRAIGGQEVRQDAGLGAQRHARFGDRAGFGDRVERATQPALREEEFDELADEDGQVISEANASRPSPFLTMMSADMNIDHGDSSCGTCIDDLSERPSVVPIAASDSACAGGGRGTIWSERSRSARGWLVQRLGAATSAGVGQRGWGHAQDEGNGENGQIRKELLLHTFAQ